MKHTEKAAQELLKQGNEMFYSGQFSYLMSAQFENFSLIEDKTEGRKTHKPTATAGGYRKVQAKLLKRGNSDVHERQSGFSFKHSKKEGPAM